MTTKHEVIQADVFDALQDLPDDYGHAAVVDYPWEFNYRNGTGRFGYSHDGDDETESGYYGPMGDSCMFQMEPPERLPELFDELSRVLVEGAWVLCFADDVFQDAVRTHLQDHDTLIFRRNWAYETKVIGMGYYGRVGHYPIPVATNGESDRYVKDRSTLYRVSTDPTAEYPTAKPVELYRELLAEPVVRQGERLLEPFCGSGPGAAIANQRGLRYWGCDTAEEAVRATKERFHQQSLTGQATLGGEL